MEIWIETGFEKEPCLEPENLKVEKKIICKIGWKGIKGLTCFPANYGAWWWVHLLPQWNCHAWDQGADSLSTSICNSCHI